MCTLITYFMVFYLRSILLLVTLLAAGIFVEYSEFGAEFYHYRSISPTCCDQYRKTVYYPLQEHTLQYTLY